MSFINLIEDDITFTDHEITARTEAMVRAQFSVEAEQILARKVMGALSGAYTMTADEQAEQSAFQQATLDARKAGEQARADNALKVETLAYEAAVRRLARLPYDDPSLDNPLTLTVTNEDGTTSEQEHPDYTRDKQERTEAQATIDGATQAVLDLAAEREAYRNPPPPPEETTDAV